MFRELIDATTDVFGIARRDLLGRNNHPYASEARQALMLVMHRRGYSAPRIADTLQRLHQSPIYHGVLRAKNREAEDEEYRAKIAKIAKLSEPEHQDNLERDGPNPLSAKRGPKPYQPKPGKARALIKRYEIDQKSVADLAAEEGVSHFKMRSFLRRCNVSMRPPGGLRRTGPDKRLPGMLKMRREGATYAEIGKQYGISRARVAQIVAENGMKEEFRRP